MILFLIWKKDLVHWNFRSPSIKVYKRVYKMDDWIAILQDPALLTKVEGGKYVQ